MLFGLNNKPVNVLHPNDCVSGWLRDLSFTMEENGKHLQKVVLKNKKQVKMFNPAICKLENYSMRVVQEECSAYW